MPYLNFLKKPQNLKLSSAANYRWRSKGKLFACWVILQFCCCLLTFFKFFKKNFMNTIRVSNSLDPDQDRRYVGPDPGPNGLQRL